MGVPEKELQIRLEVVQNDLNSLNPGTFTVNGGGNFVLPVNHIYFSGVVTIASGTVTVLPQINQPLNNTLRPSDARK